VAIIQTSGKKMGIHAGLYSKIINAFHHIECANTYCLSADQDYAGFNQVISIKKGIFKILMKIPVLYGRADLNCRPSGYESDALTS
jgi:hypothetical protein